MAAPRYHIDIALDHELSSKIGIGEPTEAGVETGPQPGEPGPGRLSTTLRPQLLRATPLYEALSGWCKHWGQMETDGDEVFNLSRPVTVIDVFLSHDWKTSRWMKLLALLVVFNSQAAAVSSLLVSVALGFAKVYLGQDLFPLWIFSGYAVFLVQLCFWQRIRSCFVAPCMVFLDKLCVHQTQMELKQEGINGLRAFVQCSEKLLVLWSDQYFNRLWCAYELGCFLSRSKRVQVEIMPLKISAILLLGSMVWHVLMFSYYLIRDSLTDGTIFTQNSQRRPWSFIYISVATVGVAVVLLPIVNYLGMSFLDDTDLLPTQVQNFRIQESECFCCKNNHEDPQTGEKLMCDRELVYQSLAELYLGEGVEAVEGSELEKFNQLVRETLGPKVLRRLGVRGTYLPLRYMSFLVMTSNFPMLSELIWHFSQGPETPLVGMTYFIWCMHLILRWLQPLLAMLFSLELSTRLWKMKNVSKLPRILLSILLSPIQSLGAGCVFASMEFAVRFSGDSTWVPLVPFLLGLLLNFILRVC